MESPTRRRALPLLLFAVAAVTCRGRACPGSCACYAPTEVHCTFRYLAAVPGQIQPAVERINLGYNSLTVLKAGDFSGLENLDLLMLHSNAINTIEDGAFQDLRSLQVLKMSYNKVKEINKETLQGLKNLVRLHMDHNLIEFINPESFYGLHALQLVHLEGNLLQQLHPDTFVTLRHSQVFKLSSVKNIHLSDNSLTSLPANIFSGCYQLENVYLHGNPWSCDCYMDWFADWSGKNPDVLKCKLDRKHQQGQLCPVCESPTSLRGQVLAQLAREAFSCSKPLIHENLKKKNITMDDGDYTPVSQKDFIAPLGRLEMNMTDQFHNYATMSCVVQRPSGMTDLNVTEHGENVASLSAVVATSLVCNVDHDQVQQLWRILATYSDMPMRLKRGLLRPTSPEMISQYQQITLGDDDIFTEIEAEIKATPAWLMQDEVSFLLDRTTTTFSALHVRYEAAMHFSVERNGIGKDGYGWTMIKNDNTTRTEHAVLIGGVAELNCQVFGKPKPSIEWILPDGSKVRAPYYSEDRRIVILDSGKLTLRSVDNPDSGIYRCIATNYLDADVLRFRITVLSPDVEEEELNGIQLHRKAGQKLILECGSEGSPKPIVHWVLPDHTVVEKTYDTRKLYGNGSLEISTLTKRDRGFYRCLTSNDLGKDLLIYQVTIIDNGSNTERLVMEEGSGDVPQPSPEENETKNASLPTDSSQKNSQDSGTISTDRPYTRFRRPHGKGTNEQRRGDSVSRRRMWGTRRVFGIGSRKVDPQQIAEFMKKAQIGQRKMNEGNLKPDVIHSGDVDVGSGEEASDITAVSSNAITLNIYDQKSVIATISNSEDNQDMATAYYPVNTFSDSMATGHNKRATTASYSMTEANPVLFPADSVTTGHFEIQRHVPTAFQAAIDYTNIKPLTVEAHLENPLRLQYTITDSTDEMQLVFSGDTPETEHERTPTINTQHVTQMMDGPQSKAKPVTHASTDPSSQTTFTAVTATQREQDEITFHTTQKITSPHLPRGSTIISHQEIHIISPNKKRQGRRRNFPSRRRIVRPNRISDIHSYLDKLKKPSVSYKGNATVPYTIEITTDCDCNDTKGEQKVFTSEQHENKPHWTTTVPPHEKGSLTVSPLFTTMQPKTEASTRLVFSATYQANPKPTTGKPTTTPYLTTKSSKLIKGKIPWHRLFGTKAGQKEILNRLRKPLRPATTTQTVTAKTTAIAQWQTPILPTAETLVAPMTASTPVSQTDVEASSDESGESSTTTEHAVQTTIYITQDISAVQLKQASTTASELRISSTTMSAPNTKALETSPTFKKGSTIDTVKSHNSGLDSRSESKGWVPPRYGGFKRRISNSRRGRFKGRRPIKERTTEATTTTTTKWTTAKIKRPETITVFKDVKPSVISSQVHSSILPKTHYLSSKKTYVSAVSSSSGTTNMYIENSKISTSTPQRKKATTEKPNATTPTLSQSRPYGTPQTHTKSNTARPNTNIRRPSEKQHHYPTHRPKVKPTKSYIKDKTKDTEKTMDNPNVLTADNSFTNIPDNRYSESVFTSKYDDMKYDATTSNLYEFESSTPDMQSKPKIMGGNAASFTVLTNSDAFLPCDVTGDPKPIISWKRFSSSTGGALSITGKMGKFEVFRNGTLFIQNANIKDRGQYVCLAENDKGSDKLLITLSVVAYPSRILEMKVRDITVHSGNSVEIGCKVDGRPAPVVSWILANRTQVRGQISAHSKVTVKPEGTLVIRQVSVYDRGHYKCIASNPAGADTATVRLHVVAAPPGIVEDKRQQVKASAGQNLWLPCTAQGSPQPTVHWVLFDGTVMQPEHYENDKVAAFSNGTLNLRSVAVSDSGKYECIATSSTGSERRVVTLTVEKTETAPLITEMSQRITQLEYGDRLQLNCSAIGDPKPRIIWRLPSKAVVDQWHRMGSRIQVLENGSLIIDSISDKDAGDYLCVARSKVGDDLQLLKVSVSMKPAKIEPNIYGKKQVPFGNDLKVDCKASGTPVPEISWGLPDGTVVNSALQADSSGRGRGRSRRYVLLDNGTLIVNKVGMAEGGDYTCYAENRLGKDEMHVHITVVTLPPQIHTVGQAHAKVKSGSNVLFDCEALGEPKPRIMWNLPSGDRIAASNQRYLMHVNGSLDIRDITHTDAGEYVCTARNAAGEDSKVFKLDIDSKPPVINGYYQNRTVIKEAAPKYSRKFIDCNVEGDPQPQITWIMPDNIFLRAPYYGSRVNVHPNGTLEIRNVRPSDMAEFICVARNDAGEAVILVQLEVTSMMRRPIFKNPFNERVMIRMGKTTALNCSVDGNPKPEIIWVLPNGTRFTGIGSRGSKYYLGNDGTFVIYSPTREDGGRFRCAAKNNMGYIEKLIILVVGQKPYILTRPRGIIRSVSGEPLFLHCLADGSPRPNIFWTFPGGHIMSHPQVKGRHQLMENGTLVIRDTVLHDRGNYVCRAKNEVGEAMLVVPVVIVAYPPRITNGPPASLQAVSGVAVHLHCAAFGMPKPEITWELPDRSVLSAAGQGRSKGTELLHPQGTLVIQKPTSLDSGTYKCLAKNFLGTDSRVTYLKVK
ncbi:immunoglobulin superfamily member 10 [Denticeps clupeoides]|uniref:Ig-like domain-containing protein n=1 Tax=Denticeps clupeoides TaxID=299321 RepID=A0AAY4DIT3_9TELE|nr:immunoglobulin superfamily member 10 [Denticeps clupeoides]